MNYLESKHLTDQIAQAYVDHAPVCSVLGWFSRGRKFAENGLAIRKASGDRWGIAQARQCLMWTIFPVGEFQEAIRQGKTRGNGV